MKQKETGITLIALVVTIVVLLILAGVSISMLTGENGIITKAKEAKSKMEEAEVSEKLNLTITEANIKSVLGLNTDIFSELCIEGIEKIEINLENNENTIIMIVKEETNYYQSIITSNTNGIVKVEKVKKVEKLETSAILLKKLFIGELSIDELDIVEQVEYVIRFKYNESMYQLKEELNDNIITISIVEESEIEPQYMIMEVGTTSDNEKINFSINTETEVIIDFGDGTEITYTGTTAKKINSKEIIKLASVNKVNYKVSAMIIESGDILVNHTYKEAGYYKIKISGNLDEIYYTSDSLKKIVQWGELKIQKIYFAFASQLESVAEANVNSFVANLDVHSAFYGCTNLIQVSQNLFEYCTEMTEIGYTFRDCKKLKTAPIIPSSVTWIGYAFDGCCSLTGEIVINMKNLEFGSGCFNDASTEEDAHLYITGATSDEIKTELLNTKSTESKIEIK